MKLKDFHQRYSIHPRPFAAGEYAAVHRARSVEGVDCVVKFYKFLRGFGSRIYDSLDLRKNIQDPTFDTACVGVLDFEFHNMCLHAVHPLVWGEFMTDPHFQRIPSSRVLERVRKELILALKAVFEFEQRGLVHGDLKPANVLMVHDRQGNPLHATCVDVDGLMRIGAKAVFTTPAYASPEALHRGPMQSRSDVFSLGCHALMSLGTMVQSASGFFHCNREYIEERRTRDYDFEGAFVPRIRSSMDRHFPEGAREVVQALLRFASQALRASIDSRPGAQEAIQILEEDLK